MKRGVRGDWTNPCFLQLGNKINVLLLQSFIRDRRLLGFVDDLLQLQFEFGELSCERFVLGQERGFLSLVDGQFFS